MELLFSNHAPLITGTKTFYDAFYNCLADSTQIDIAVGYVTADSLIELRKAVEDSSPRQVNLIIGMHYIERFSRLEYDAAIDLHSFLKENSLGGVKLVTPFRYHGKLYVYSNASGPFVGIIGSDNLSGIVKSKNRVYEASFLIDSKEYVDQIYNFVEAMSGISSVDIDQLTITDFRQHSSPLANHDDVEKVNPAELAQCLASRTDISFDIPIKAGVRHTKSNLNTFHGKGRESKNGLIKPRHWYEVELIVERNITLHPNYPEQQTSEAVFEVITDDGWKFKCKVSGENSKNFRSYGDLTILGKWLKGRLENAGVLKVGELVTEETLGRYGRDTLTLTKTQIPQRNARVLELVAEDNPDRYGGGKHTLTKTRIPPQLWYLDFGVK